MNNNKIGIFDSGIGGVTVLKEIIKILPNEKYIYYSDSKNNPYGDKSDDEILKICDKIVSNFINENCKAIVIACNTASAKASKKLREKYPNKPIIAIEPAYKMVHDFAYDETSLVMATKGTIESEKFHKLYEKYNNHKTYLLACPGLADIIEEGNKEKIKEYLKENLSKYSGKVDNVVLGCTHYPLIQDEIREILGNVKFFNGAPNLAKHLKDVLKENELLSDFSVNTFNADNSINDNNKNDNNGKKEIVNTSIEEFNDLKNNDIKVNKNFKYNIDFIDSSNSEFKKKRFYSYLMVTD